MVEFKADGNDVGTNGFVDQFIKSTIFGALSCLRGPDNLIGALLVVENGLATKLTLNTKPAEMNPFISKALGGIVTGIAAALHDNGNAERFEIRIA